VGGPGRLSAGIGPATTEGGSCSGTTPHAVALSAGAAAAAADAVVPGMRERKHGTLLFTTGGAAVEPHRSSCGDVAAVREPAWLTAQANGISFQATCISYRRGWT
jgi:hypothetical protein